MSDVGIIEDGAVAVSDGIITHVGPTEEVLRQVDVGDYLEVDASGRALCQGLWIAIRTSSSVVTARRSSLGG